MKKKVVLAFVALIIISTKDLVAQSANLKTSEMFMLVDITDPGLFSQIVLDFEENLPTFFQTVGLGKIGELERFTLKIAPIGATQELVVKSASIAIPRKGLALQEQRRLSNPQILTALIKQNLADYGTLTAANNSASYIIDIVLKSISQSDDEAERSVLVIQTDGMEFSPICNTYKKVPTTTQEIDALMNNIDVTTLNRAKQKVKTSKVEIVIVLKRSTGSRNVSELRNFWTELLNRVGITSLVFIDNFTQKF